MKKIFLIFILCFSTSTISSYGQETNKIKTPIIKKVKFNGSWYWLGVPKNKKIKSFPIIVALHGDEGHPNNMKRFWEDLWKKKQNFIFLAPECPRGICNKGGVNTWSKGGYNGSQPQALWLKKTINQVVKEYSADEKRIYAAGYSGGAIFLGYQGFKMFQDVFAGIQWFCGGVNETEKQVYKAPKNPDCKVPGRLIISKKGDLSYLITAADRISEILKNNGHQNAIPRG